MARPAALLLLAALAGCGERGQEQGGTAMHGAAAAALDTAGLRSLAVPAEHQQGRALFQQSCAVCHGEAALGTAQGPPLVHVVYEPNHHADAAFLLAARQGVRAHHWGFGDMPPVPAVSPEQVGEIVGYVRWLQRQAGVY